MNGRVVLVTGASSGIGLACADHLHVVGWTVVGASRRGTGGLGWEAITMDVDDDASVADGVADVIARHGRLDAVLACAGWGLAGAVECTPIDRAKAQFETNFWGAVRVVQAALPSLRAAPDGRVVLMSSIGGAIGIPFQAYYSSSKFALEGYGESLAHEVSPHGVKVTLVQPGNFRTGFTDAREDVPVRRDDPYAAAANRAVSKMADDEQRGDDPTEVAAVVARVLHARRPPRRVSVGSAGERVGLLARRLLPWRVFERASRSSLGL